MRLFEESIVYPKPDAKILNEFEKLCKLKLPEDYKCFITNYNGAEPVEKYFEYNHGDHVVTRFLCILENPNASPDGWYDICVIESQIGERLTDNEDLIGIEVLPIAELFAGDYLCLDFREDKENPSVCVWDHEESDDFEPVTYKVADSFTEFVKMLKE